MAPKTRNGRHTHNRFRDEIDVQSPIGDTNQEDGHAREQGSTSRNTFNNQPHDDLENMSFDREQNDVTNEESNQNSEDEFHDAEKRTRGLTFMAEIWGRPNTLPRIRIQCDSLGRPLSTKKDKFTDFLGTVARSGKYCPTDVEDWHKMKMENKKAMLDNVKERSEKNKVARKLKIMNQTTGRKSFAQVRQKLTKERGILCHVLNYFMRVLLMPMGVHQVVLWQKTCLQ